LGDLATRVEHSGRGSPRAKSEVQLRIKSQSETLLLEIVMEEMRARVERCKNTYQYANPMENADIGDLTSVLDFVSELVDKMEDLQKEVADLKLGLKERKSHE